MRWFRAGYREIDGRTYAIVWDGNTGEELMRKDITDDTPNPIFALLRDSAAKFKKYPKIEGTSITIKLT